MCNILFLGKKATEQVSRMHSISGSIRLHGATPSKMGRERKDCQMSVLPLFYAFKHVARSVYLSLVKRTCRALLGAEEETAHDVSTTSSYLLLCRVSSSWNNHCKRSPQTLTLYLSVLQGSQLLLTSFLISSPHFCAPVPISLPTARPGRVGVHHQRLPPTCPVCCLQFLQHANLPCH